MKKLIPYEKLSKKKKRELDLKKRGSWYGLNPVTRRPELSRAYNRSKARQWRRDLPDRAFSAPVPRMAEENLRDKEAFGPEFQSRSQILFSAGANCFTIPWGTRRLALKVPGVKRHFQGGLSDCSRTFLAVTKQVRLVVSCRRNPGSHPPPLPDRRCGRQQPLLLIFVRFSLLLRLQCCKKLKSASGDSSRERTAISCPVTRCEFSAGQQS